MNYNTVRDHQQLLVVVGDSCRLLVTVVNDL